MDGSSSSSSSSSSFGSFYDVSVETSVKFLCSYGGMILPRRPDGRLRYVGGHTRVLAVRRPISFSELQGKMRELCGWTTVSLRCQLPTEDMDALVSVTSDEDLANLVEVYRVSSRGRPSPLKIRAFLVPSARPSVKTPPAMASAAGRCVRQVSAPGTHNGRYEKAAASAASAAAGDAGFQGRRHQLRRRGHW